MDLTKKRKLDENGTVETDFSLSLTPQDIRKIIEPFSQEQLLDILQNAAHSHPDVLDAVRSVADGDLAQRKLFVRGLGWETTNDSLRSIFAAYGELEEAAVILDKATSKSKGYGFVTYRHIDGAILALKEPSKTIDGRVAVSQLASAGVGPNSSSNSAADVSLRKIYVGNVPYDMPSGKLLNYFMEFGEVEEGPLGFDKQTGKSKGFALFVYKTPEGAQAALANPTKVIDGRQLLCKLASEGKKGKPGGGPMGPGQGQGPGGEGMGMQSGGPMQPSYAGVGGQGGYSGYPGYPGGHGMGHHQNPNSSYQSGGHGPGGGYNGGYGGSHYGGPNSAGYGGPNASGYSGGSGGPGGYGGPGGGSGGSGRGSSMYGMPPGSAGMPSGGYNDGGHYGSSGYPGSQHQQSGTSPAPRVGPGGMYPNAPPYY